MCAPCRAGVAQLNSGMIQKLRKLLASDPFQPFTVALADGRRFDIRSPDMIWMPGDGHGGLHIFVPEKDWIVSVNIMLLASVEFAAPTLSEHPME